MLATLARMLMDAPGPFKAAAAVPAFYAVDHGVDAFRNYQQMQGTHPMQERQRAWERQMEEAGMPMQQPPIGRGNVGGK